MRHKVIGHQKALLYQFDLLRNKRFLIEIIFAAHFAFIASNCISPVWSRECCDDHPALTGIFRKMPAIACMHTGFFSHTLSSYRMCDVFVLKIISMLFTCSSEHCEYRQESDQVFATCVSARAHELKIYRIFVCVCISQAFALYADVGNRGAHRICGKCNAHNNNNDNDNKKKRPMQRKQWWFFEHAEPGNGGVTKRQFGDDDADETAPATKEYALHTVAEDIHMCKCIVHGAKPIQ